MSTRYDLPSFDACSTKMDNREELNPIEAFIYHNEPAAAGADVEFRDALAKALDFWVEKWFSPKPKKALKTSSDKRVLPCQPLPPETEVTFQEAVDTVMAFLYPGEDPNEAEETPDD